jgi:PEGA domain
MHAATQTVRNPSPAEFTDGFGRRVRLTDPSSPEPLEVFQFEPELLTVQSFEFMLRERVSRLANFRHAYYSRVRRVDRLDGGKTLGLVSESPQGARLSRVLEVAAASNLDLDVNAALCLVRQLVPAVAMLHQNARDVSHGALAPERIVVTAGARVVIVEYVLGAAIEQLSYSRERLWKDLRVAVPSGAGIPRLTHRVDVMQLGMVALALVLGRPLAEEDLKALPALVASATECTSPGTREPISEPLRRWLIRALQLDARSSFESALESQLALDDVLSGESGYIAAPIALETFLTRYEECEAALPPPPPIAPPQPIAPTPIVAAAPIVPVAVPPPPAPAAPVPPARVAPVYVAPVASVPAAPAVSVLAAPVASVPVASAFAVPATADKPVAPVAPDAPESPDVAVDALREMLKAAPPTQVATAGVPTFWRVAALALGVIAVAEGGFIGWKLLGGRGTGTAPGNVRLDSKPEGAQVKIDGESKGVTPLSTSLSSGPHVLELSTGGEPRVIPITVNAGETLGQYVELSGAPSLGRLSISSQPGGATVLLDGQPRGTAPAELSDVSAGDHELVLELNGVRIRQAVSVAAGTVTTVAVPMKVGSTPVVAAAAGAEAGTPAPAEPTTGGLTVKVPFEMQVFEGQTLVGVTGDRLVLSPGPHDLRVVSDTLGFEKPLHAEIFAGKTTHLSLPLPKGTLSLNATPWAEVWIDGAKVGETPIGNLSLPVGPHEVVFKNPDLGEQHHAATVTATAPVRLSVDLSKPQQ